MAGERKKESILKILIRGSGAALLVYVLGILLTAQLLVKGVFPENGIRALLAINSMLATICGCLVSLGRSPLGKLPTALLISGSFCSLLILAAFCLWQGVSWAGEGGTCLLCAMLGGVLSAFLGSRKRRKGKRGRK